MADPMLGWRIAKCPHCGEELTVHNPPAGPEERGEGLECVRMHWGAKRPCDQYDDGRELCAPCRVRVNLAATPAPDTGAEPRLMAPCPACDESFDVTDGAEATVAHWNAHHAAPDTGAEERLRAALEHEGPELPPNVESVAYSPWFTATCAIRCGGWAGRGGPDGATVMVDAVAHLLDTGHETAVQRESSVHYVSALSGGSVDEEGPHGSD